MPLTKKKIVLNRAHKVNYGKESVGRAYDLMEYYFRIAVAINAVPFTYSSGARRFDLNRSSIKYLLWNLIVFIGILAELAQVTYELLRTKDDSRMSRGEWALIAFIFSSWTFVSSCHYNVARRGDGMVNHLNQTIALREWFTEERLPKCSDHKIVRAHIISSCLQCFFQCLMVAAEGTKAHFLYSNVPVEHRSLLTGFAWFLYAYYRVTTNFLSGYFHLFAGALHVQTCNQILALRLEGKQDMRENLHYYRMLQILCSRYSETYSGWFIPQMTKFACENLILGIYGTVKFYDQLDTDKYMNFPLMVTMMIIFVFTFYPKNATVFETTKGEKKQALRRGLRRLANSVWRCPKAELAERMAVGRDSSAILMKELGVISQWQKYPDEVLHQAAGLVALKDMKCISRSCPIIGIPFGSLYKIKRSTVLNLFSFIAGNTISTLLTYP